MEKESKEKVKREPKCLLIQHWALILAGKERERHMQSELAIFPGTRTTSASFSDKRGLPQRATPVQITFYSWQLLTTILDTIMFFESNQSRAICKEISSTLKSTFPPFHLFLLSHQDHSNAYDSFMQIYLSFLSVSLHNVLINFLRATSYQVEHA